MVYYNHQEKGVVFMTKRETLIQMYSDAIWSEFCMWVSEYCCSQEEAKHEKNIVEQKINDFTKICNTLKEE